MSSEEERLRSLVASAHRALDDALRQVEDVKRAVSPQLLPVRDVARELGCSKSKVRALIAKEDGEPGTGLPAVRIDGMVRVRREDLEALLKRWGIRSTGSDNTEESGAPSRGTDAISSGSRWASRRQRALGTMQRGASKT